MGVLFPFSGMEFQAPYSAFSNTTWDGECESALLQSTKCGSSNFPYFAFADGSGGTIISVVFIRLPISFLGSLDGESRLFLGPF